MDWNRHLRVMVVKGEVVAQQRPYFVCRSSQDEYLNFLSKEMGQFQGERAFSRQVQIILALRQNLWVQVQEQPQDLGRYEFLRLCGLFTRSL